MQSPRGVSWRVLSSQLLLASAALGFVSGCQFFSRSGSGDAVQQSKATGLPPLLAASDALRLDVLLVDRRADDPLIGPLLWQEIDQVGAVPTETRNLLQENGCIVGHVAATPPLPLLKLLGVTPEIDGVEAANTGPAQSKVSGRTYAVRSGTESEVQTSDSWPECELTVVDPEGTRALQLKQLRCVFRIKPLRLQDGWVRVEFVPELHHGEMKLRHLPTDDVGWALKTAQNIDQCYPQKFAITLNVGESAVITAEGDSKDSLGDRFFRRDANGELRQRLLIVRLVDMGQGTGPDR